MRDVLLRLGRRVVVAALEQSIAVVEVALVVLGAPPLVVVSPPPKEPHDADPADVDPVPDVPSCTERGLHRSEEGRPDAGGQLSAAAPCTNQGREEGEPTAGPVDLFGEFTPIVDRDVKPENVQTPRYRCRKCGFVGCNSRGCGTSHPTQTTSVVPRDAAELDAKPMTAIEPPPSKSLHLKPTTEAVTKAKERIARRTELAARAADSSAPRRAPDVKDSNPNAEERWSPERRYIEATIAEGAKRSGELPVPRSTWVF